MWKTLSETDKIDLANTIYLFESTTFKKYEAKIGKHFGERLMKD